VTLQADKDARAAASDLSRLYVRNVSGRMVPLSTLGDLKPIVGPETLTHYNNHASALINGVAASGYSSRQAVAAMERAAETALPRDFAFEWTGITFEELKAGSISTATFALAIIFVFLILAAQYESWTMPFMVLLAVPLALFGALLALWLRDRQIDVYSQIGFVMLIGFAAKNAILIVEFARRRRDDGLDIVEAAMEAARLRLRPILMTSFAFILGVVPLMFATGAGAASRQSVGTTVFGGMVAATILTLILVPVSYAIIEQLREANFRDESTAANEAPEGHTEPAAQDLEFGIMRSWKIAFAATAVTAVVVIAFIFWRGDSQSGGTTAIETPSPASTALLVPVTKIVKKDIPIYLDYSARTESIRNIALQAKVPSYIQQQHVSDGTDVKEGDLLYTIDPRDLQAALSTMRVQISNAAPRWRKAATSPKTTSTSAPAPQTKQRRRSRWIGPQSEPRNSTSATRKSARRSPRRAY
jgi:hypothetical protein